MGHPAEAAGAVALARSDQGSGFPNRAVLEAELANVLNLAWFETVEVTPDGTTLVFAGA